MRSGEGARDTGAACRESWDLFCRVVDNYGDIGVAWRLARQLGRAARRSVRLRVDDLHAFGRIEPRVDARVLRQRIDAVEIIRWRHDDREPVVPADVVVELFGCGLPQRYVDAMAGATADAVAGMTRRPTIWLDLEYLSAETWTDEFHGLPSPHPTLPLVKHFFYPGFSAQTGGVSIEPALDHERRAFIENPDRVADFWRRLKVPPPAPGEMRVSLFAYPDAPFESLFEAMAGDRRRRWTVVVPEGLLPRGSGETMQRRCAPSVFAIPFVSQDEFDRLLWSCDINFVRGEDSFVRAQAAARPFIWHIYPQADDAHLAKLDAFETRYEAGLSQAARAAQRALGRAWNQGGEDFSRAWPTWCEALPELTAHAQAWRLSLASRPGLVDRLAAFVAERRAALLK